MNMLSIRRRTLLGLIGGLAAIGAGFATPAPAFADETVTLWSWRTEDEAAMRRRTGWRSMSSTASWR